MINNDITEDKVGFEVAKLLREKGFKNSNVENFWLMYPDGKKVGEEFLDKSFDNSITPTLIHLKSPIQSLAAKWIRENFNIHIYIEPAAGEWYITIKGVGNDIYESLGSQNTPEEAIETGLLYTLKNLIP